jgi:hypothetical protein
MVFGRHDHLIGDPRNNTRQNQRKEQRNRNIHGEIEYYRSNYNDSDYVPRMKVIVPRSAMIRPFAAGRAVIVIGLLGVGHL